MLGGTAFILRRLVTRERSMTVQFLATLTAKIDALKWVKISAANAVTVDLRYAKCVTIGNLSCGGCMFFMLLNESNVLNIKQEYP